MTGRNLSMVVTWLCGMLASAAGCSAQASMAEPEAAGPASVIVLVRHAEAIPEPGGDPVLSRMGKDRAERLAALLRDADIGAIHSTGYRRTRGTAAPLAAALGMPPGEYDPRDLPGLAASLRRAGGRHLVVGHSNTTPQLVRLLGGDPGADIAETEYDRIYILFLEPDAVRTVVLRY